MGPICSPSSEKTLKENDRALWMLQFSRTLPFWFSDIFQLLATLFPICTWKPYVIINSLCTFWRKYVLLLKDPQLCHCSGKPCISTAKWHSLYLLCFESGYKLTVKWNGGILFFKLLPFLSLKPFTWINWEKRVAFALSPQIKYLIMSSTSSPPWCMCLPALWFTEMEPSSPSFSEQFVGAYAVQTFLENPPEEDRWPIKRHTRTLWRAHSLHEFSISSKAAFIKGIFFSFSAKTQTLDFHFFTASHNVIWVPLSPGWQTGGQAAFLDDWAPAPAFPRNHTLR